MAAENIDNTVDGAGLFNTKIPGLSDAADIQAALRLYHYGIYGYDGANTDPARLATPSIAKHLQNLVDADAAEVVNRNAAISVETTNRNTAITSHNSATTNVHGIPNTANLATQAFVTTSITNAVNGATGGYPGLAGEAIDWNSVDLRFDVEPRIANTGTVTTKTESFILSPDDVGKTAVLYSSNPMTVTLPANDSVEIPVGYSIDIIQTGSGSVTVSEESNAVLINSKSNIKSLDGQYSKGTLVKIDTNTWFFFGNLLNVVTPVAPVAPTPTAPVPVSPTPTTPVPVEPTPTAPVAPTPPAPVELTPTPPAPVAPVAPTAPAPTQPVLTTPSVNVTFIGSGAYPLLYATINNSNYDSSASYSANMGAQNQEFPEEWILENLSEGQSYTFSLTASKNGFTSSTGSVTFTANYSTPTPTAPTPVAPTAPTPPAPTPTAPVAPVAPTPVAPTPAFAISSISSTSNSVTYSWSNAPSGTAFYEVYYADNDVVYPTSTTGSTSKTFSGLNPNTPHTVFVRAKNSSNSTLASDSASISTSAAAPTPVAPVAPTPPAPTPVAPVAPTAPTPVAPTARIYYGCCANGTAVSGEYANGEQAFNSLESDCQFSYNSTLSGGVSLTQPNCTPAPTPVAPTPPAPTATIWYCTTNYAQSQIPDENYESPTNETGSSCGSYATACSTSGYPASPPIPVCAPTPVAPVAPTPPAPTPVAPVAPVAPTPPAPTPVAPVAPVAPTPPAPTPTAPVAPVAPTPPAPTPTAPVAPVAPTPPACTPGNDCGTTTNEATCKTTIRQYNSSCNCVVTGIYNFC